MATTSSLRGLSVPVVSSDSGLWGSELNASLGDLDTILGGTTTLQSSNGLSQTLTTSMAQTGRIIMQGTSSGPMTLTFASSLYANGVYSVWNATPSSLAFGMTCQTTGVGSNCTVPANSQRLVQVDGTNAYFADQVALPSFNVPPILNNYLSGFQISNSGTTGLNIGTGLAADQSNACYMAFGGMTKSAGSLWAAGSGNGAMGNGLGFSPGLTYHIFEISNSTNNASSNIASSSVDIYFDTSITAANAPINTNFHRRVASLMTFSSAPVWRPIVHFGDSFNHVTQVLEVNNAAPPGTPTLRTLSGVPTGLNVFADLVLEVAVGNVSAGADTTLWVYTPSAGNPIPNAGTAMMSHSRAVPNVFTEYGFGQVKVLTNQSAQVNVVAAGDLTGGHSILTMGWTDIRGKDGPP